MARSSRLLAWLAWAYSAAGHKSLGEFAEHLLGRQVSGTTRDIQACSNQSHCVVPKEETWLVTASMEFETLTVRGTLVWDTTVEALELRTGYLLVEHGGLFQLGRPAAPMEKAATVHITKGPFEHPKLGYRFLGTLGHGSRINIHGRELARTWTLLSRDAKPGSRQLFLRDDAEAMGWRPGDRIGLATTQRGKSTRHRIQRIGPATEWLLPPRGAEAGKGNATAGEAIDRDTTTMWWTWWTKRAMADKHWLSLTLQERCHLTRVRVNFHPNRYAPHYAVQVMGRSGDNWTTAAEVTNGHGGWQEVMLGLDAVALRIHVPNYDALKTREPQAEPAWAGLWLREVEVFGRELSAPSPTVLHLTEPLKQEHWGGFREIQGRRFEMAAEVVNLERSVLITGDHDDFETTKQGLHTIMHGPGIMDMRYARVEYCGQRDSMGRYCLHFHLGGQCPECVFAGNAIVDSQQVGITLHGTHRTLIESNVIWDARGVGLYVEDGNEMDNIIRHNVLVCSWYTKCSVPWLLPAAHAGIYMIGMTNDLIGNHIVGYENGIWTPGAVYSFGQGVAAHRVCPQFLPFGAIRGNVNHDCIRFGLYLDNQSPRRLVRDSNGYVTNGCNAFTDDGSDNGVVPANLVEDEFDWHNTFVGQYSMGDVSFVRYTSVNNGHPMYWKASKNFADGRSHHIRDSLFANHRSLGYGALQLLGPSGPFTFLLTNTSFLGGPVGCGGVCAGQHCGRSGAGGPCNAQYLLQDVDFSGMDAGTKHVKFGVNSLGPGFVLPVFASPPGDSSLGGLRSIVSRHLTGFGNLSACRRTGWTYDKGYGCDAPVRRLNLWSKDLGVVHLAGPGYGGSPDWASPTAGMNAGLMPFQATPDTANGGYGMPVLLGSNYTLTGAWRGDVVPEFSDPVMSQYFGEEALNVSFESGVERQCELRPSDSRAFLGASGPAQGLPPRSHCEIGQPLATTQTTSTTAGSTTLASCAGRPAGACSFANSPGVPYFWDPCCLLGQLGCRADGANNECRFCGAGPWSGVACPSTTTTTTLEGVSRFQKLRVGACASLGLAPINSLATCQAAAAALGLQDTTASSVQHPDRPEGCYWFQGSSLWLNTDAGSAGKGAETSEPDKPRHPLCEVPRFQVLSNGTCADIGWLPIVDAGACGAAAAVLGLNDTVAKLTDTALPRPEGCYLFNRQYLWLGSNPANVGRGAEASEEGALRHPICRPRSSNATAADLAAEPAAAPPAAAAAADAAASASDGHWSLARLAARVSVLLHDHSAWKRPFRGPPPRGPAAHIESS